MADMATAATAGKPLDLDAVEQELMAVVIQADDSRQEAVLFASATQIIAKDLLAELRRLHAVAEEDTPIAQAQRRERLAAYAHIAWSGWMEYLFQQATGNADGTIMLPVWAVRRWQRQAATPYADLPEAEKQSDRVEADRMLALWDGNGR